MNAKMNNRLLSLDVLRGLTVAGMIVVNNGAGEPFIPLEHAEWNGMTPCDLVFPFFLFMVGVSMAFSLGKFTQPATSNGPQPSKTDAIKKVLSRTLKLIVIGLTLNVLTPLLKGSPDILANLRFWGILQRIAVCYCITSFIVLYVKPKYFWKIIIALLTIYGVILLTGNGYANDETNLAAIIDRALFGQSHLYAKAPIDPEGLLGSISSVAHTLIGVIVGFHIKQKEELSMRLTRIFTLAASIAIIGYLLSYGLPLNKRVWSPSYVLVTCGIAASLLGVFTMVIDIQKKQDWCHPFQWFGMNAISLFVASALLARFFSLWKIPGTLSQTFLSWGCTEQWASLLYALSFLAVNTLLAWAMYKRKIFIKL